MRRRGAESYTEPLPSLPPIEITLEKGKGIIVSTSSDSVDGAVNSYQSLLSRPGGDGISLQEAVLVTNNEPDYYTNIEGPHVKYDDYAQFEGVKESFRRTPQGQSQSYSLCSRGQGYTSYTGYSSFGFINYSVPLGTSMEEVREMDEIVAKIGE